MIRCHVCDREVKGNLDASKAIKCSHCLNGEVEYIRNNPDDFPEAFAPLNAKPKLRIRVKKTKQPKGTTLATC